MRGCTATKRLNMSHSSFIMTISSPLAGLSMRPEGSEPKPCISSRIMDHEHIHAVFIDIYTMDRGFPVHTTYEVWSLGFDQLRLSLNYVQYTVRDQLGQ